MRKTKPQPQQTDFCRETEKRKVQDETAKPDETRMLIGLKLNRVHLSLRRPPHAAKTASLSLSTHCYPKLECLEGEGIFFLLLHSFVSLFQHRKV